MDVRVVLVEPKRDENVGAVARVMKNFGFIRFILSAIQWERRRFMLLTTLKMCLRNASS